MSIIGFDGKEYDSVEAMQAAMAQQDRDKLRARGKEIGFDDAFFGSDEFTQFEKDNPYNSAYAAVVVDDPYGFGNSPRTSALANSYSQYLQRTGQQGKIKTDINEGGRLFQETRPKFGKEGPEAFEETMVDYYRLPDGTGFAKNRATREAVPPGAVQISQDEFTQLTPRNLLTDAELANTGAGTSTQKGPADDPDLGSGVKKGEELEQELIAEQVRRVEATDLPAGRTITPVNLGVKPGEIVNPIVGRLEEFTATESAPSIDSYRFNQTAPEATPAAQVQAAQVTDTPTLTAAKSGPSTGALMEAAQGQLSQESLAKAATQELDPRATTRYQIAELFSSIEEGKPLPAWAAPAVRRVTSVMQQRGLGASSMAAAATVQAIMESGLPIAAQDAQKYSAIQLQNLSNQQQAALQNAAASAQMDTANLNARQQALANNAKSFLTLDVQNLTNEQQAATIDYQGKVQTLLTNMAQENAARQLNAKTQTQVDMFFAELGTQVESATINRKAAIEQYNVSQQNAMAQFNSQMQTAREQFNANMSAQIAQSNAQWRRNINTSNTATQNAANQQNVMNVLGINQQALANLWQAYRDQASWNLQISENNLARAHNAAMQAMAIASNESMYDEKFDDFLVIKTIDNIFRPLS